MKYLSLVALLLLAGCKIEQGNYPESPDSSATETISHDQTDMSAAKVAAVMAAEGITLPQVASYLNTYGFDVVSRASTMRLHWAPAPPGRDAQGNTVPVAYYVVNLRLAVGDTMMAIYAPTHVGQVHAKIKAYDGRGMSGAWSDTTVGGTGGLLPGVQE